MAKATKLSTPWGLDGVSQSFEQKPPPAAKTYKAAWIHGSSILREEEERKKNMPAYETKAPWEPQVEDAIDDFDKRLAGEDFKFPDAPWNKVEPNNEVKVNPDVKEYKYQSLHAPIPMSKERQEQLAKYKYDPPFSTDFNNSKSVNGVKKSAAISRPTTVAPWAYGDLEPDPSGGKKSITVRKDTSLWTTPVTEKSLNELLESSGDPILDKLRQTLKERGAMGIFGLSKKFKIMDDDNSGFLSESEFNKAMIECRLELTKQQLKHLFRYFDKSDDGNISYDEFLVGIRGVLNKRRRAMVRLAFNILDKDGSGIIDMDDIINVYDVSKHPDYIARRRTKEDILREFISSMEVGADKDGKV